MAKLIEKLYPDRDAFEEAVLEETAAVAERQRQKHVDRMHTQLEEVRRRQGG